MTEPEVVLAPRSGVQELIDRYADGELNYEQLYCAVHDAGYSTRSLYEAVRDIRPRSKNTTGGSSDEK